jgi:hypothetical protein
MTTNGHVTTSTHRNGGISSSNNGISNNGISNSRSRGSRRVCASNLGKYILFHFNFTLLFYSILFCWTNVVFFTIRLHAHEVLTPMNDEWPRHHLNTPKWRQQQQE